MSHSHPAAVEESVSVGVVDAGTADRGRGGVSDTEASVPTLDDASPPQLMAMRAASRGAYLIYPPYAPAGNNVGSRREATLPRSAGCMTSTLHENVYSRKNSLVALPQPMSGGKSRRPSLCCIEEAFANSQALSLRRRMRLCGWESRAMLL